MGEPQSLQKLRDALKKKGCHGMVSFVREFKRMDINRDKLLSAEELKKGLTKLGITTSDEELAAILQHFDKNGDGKIDTDEFIEGVKPPLPEPRMKVVTDAFSELDKNVNGFISVEDLKGEIKFGDVVQTDERVLRDFLDVFDYGNNPDGKITYQEFVAYYCTMSKGIESDEIFEKVVKAQWQL